MVRVKISFGIILAIITLGIISFFVLEHNTSHILTLLSQTEEYADMGDSQKALSKANELLEEWSSYHKYASVFVNNGKISAAQSSLSRIKALIEAGNDELQAEFETARSAILWIIESELPRLTNIL